jgi:hypothetical protein
MHRGHWAIALGTIGPGAAGTLSILFVVRTVPAEHDSRRDQPISTFDAFLSIISDTSSAGVRPGGSQRKRGNTR